MFGFVGTNLLDSAQTQKHYVKGCRWSKQTKKRFEWQKPQKPWIPFNTKNIEILFWEKLSFDKVEIIVLKNKESLKLVLKTNVFINYTI